MNTSNRSPKNIHNWLELSRYILYSVSFFSFSFFGIFQELTCFLKIIEDLATRPMQMATYFCTGDVMEENFRHYALNMPFYTHFTSPIRRYADVCVHRLLLAALTGSGKGLWSKSAISQISKDCNTKKTNARKAQMVSSIFGFFHSFWRHVRQFYSFSICCMRRKFRFLFFSM